MSIDLYTDNGSPPCNTVLLTAAALNLKPNIILVDLPGGGHLTPQYLKLNPQHTVPTLVDNGFPLVESRAIVRYLVNKYGGDTDLYPKDPQARAIIDHRLDFDLGTLYQKFADYFYPQFHGGLPPTDAAFKKLQEALGILNTLLEGSKYAAGSELTIADFCLVSTVAAIDGSDISLDENPNILKNDLLMFLTECGHEVRSAYKGVPCDPRLQISTLFEFLYDNCHTTVKYVTKICI